MSIQSGRALWFSRSFLMLAALWVVAQGHSGSFLGPWRNEASLPGNACWLLILYCLARMLLDWGLASVKLWRFSREALFFLACLAALELAWQALGNAGIGNIVGLAAFFVQPLIVLLGLAALHRRQPVAG